MTMGSESELRDLRRLDSNKGTFPEIMNESGYKNSSKDGYNLARLGKKERLKRRFGFLSLFGFSCTILITWETALALFTQAFTNGGPAGVVWGFLIAWICSISVYMTLAEMASMAPIAGGQYFWVSILAPRSSKRFLSYITGWLTTLAWIAVLAVGAIFTGTIVQGLIKLNHESYADTAENWHGTLLSWSIIAVAVFINTIAAGSLPFFEGTVLFIHIIGWVAIVIALLYLSPKVSASDVFLTSLNEGGWSTQGLSYCVGFIGNVATFVGADAAVHMAEEIENAAENVPRAIFVTLLLNGTMGLGMIIALLFCLTDIDAATNSITGFPFIQVFADGTGPIGANVMTIAVVTLAWAAVIGFLATASRMTWSFARDKGLPFHKWISKVEPRTKIPIYAVALVTAIPCLLTLIYIGSPTAYEDIISITVSGLYGSYLIPSALLLWRRATGQVKHHGYTASLPPTQVRTASLGNTSELGLVKFIPSTSESVLLEPIIEWGPWKVPGMLGTINNAFAVVYAVFVLFWNFWPTTPLPGAAGMNWSIVVTGSVMLFSVVYYYVWGKGQYKGPLIDLEVRDVATRYVVIRERQ